MYSIFCYFFFFFIIIIILLGTHASGAYLTNYGTTKSLFIREHAISQYFDVWSQLVFGIRYLDLSIG